MIRGFDNAVNEMNACFSNMLWELQKEEIEAKEREERKERMARELEENKVRLIQKRKDDLLKGNPFKLATNERASKRQPILKISNS